MRNWGGGEGGQGGPQGFGDSWHERERGRERWKETGRRRGGRQERDNVIRLFEMMRIFMRVFIRGCTGHAFV